MSLASFTITRRVFFISSFYVNKYYTQVCLLSEEHRFKLPNTYHRIHISTFRKKKNYTNAIARDTKVRISTGRIIQIRRRIINTN